MAISYKKVSHIIVKIVIDKNGRCADDRNCGSRIEELTSAPDCSLVCLRDWQPSIDVFSSPKCAAAVVDLIE